MCGMRDESVFKHEVAYVLGQMQNPHVYTQCTAYVCLSLYRVPRRLCSFVGRC